MKKSLVFGAAAAMGLSGCMMGDPGQYLVGQQGGNNIYEFGVARYAAINGQEAYYHQRDNFAAGLCPQGYRIIDERADSTYVRMGMAQATQYIIRISCPA